jgi:indole-3-glycerol phosphate synthase
MTTDIPTSPSLNTQLANAVVAVTKAQNHLIEMQRFAAQARSRETDALSAVNTAQKQFDALVAEVKKSAPPSTDWRKLPVRMFPEP